MTRRRSTAAAISIPPKGWKPACEPTLCEMYTLRTLLISELIECSGSAERTEIEARLARIEAEMERVWLT
jgi:hypothetical protein